MKTYNILKDGIFIRGYSNEEKAKDKLKQLKDSKCRIEMWDVKNPEEHHRKAKVTIK